MAQLPGGIPSLLIEHPVAAGDLGPQHHFQKIGGRPIIAHVKNQKPALMEKVGRGRPADGSLGNSLDA